MHQGINRKRYVRYKEGAEIYSMCQSKFEKLAKKARDEKVECNLGYCNVCQG